MGPLNGIRVIELGGLGPAPFGCMMLADQGAEVVRIERGGGGRVAATEDAGRGQADPRRYIPHRNRRSVALDLKSPSDRETLLQLVERADAFVEGYRPGVAERLGVGPDDCLARNPRLVYARMTGWGQTGPLAPTAGHDINYIALAGALDNFRREGEPPLPPLNVVGDMGGGGMLLAFGVAAALLHVARTGQGQVVDAAMVDGAALQLVTTLGMRAQGRWPGPPGTNSSDTGAPFYEVYECSDGKFVAIGALEQAFWEVLVGKLGITSDDIVDRDDPTSWQEGKRRLAQIVRTRSRDDWAALFEGTDACVTPVLSLDEAARHPHAQARGAFVDVGGVVQPAPAPRFSRTPAGIPSTPPMRGADTNTVLRDWGITDAAAE